MSPESQLLRGLSALCLALIVVASLRLVRGGGRPAALSAMQAETYVPRATRRAARPVLTTHAVVSLARGVSLNINEASAEELVLLPGLGPALATRITEYRQRHGAFSSLEGLVQIRGIGEAKLARLRQFLRAETLEAASR